MGNQSDISLPSLPNDFVRGYIAALFVSAHFQVNCIRSPMAQGESYTPSFSDLAPETLVAILKDCAAVSDWRSLSRMGFAPGAKGGRQFWETRQAGKWALYRPLTPFLGDDGRIYLRDPEARSTGSA